MTFRNLDASGDWTFGHGRQDYAAADRAIGLNVATRLRSFLNDCFWAMGAGVDWWNLLGAKNPSAQIAIVLQCRTVIAGSFGIVRINAVQASTDSVTRLLGTRYDVDSIYTRNLRNAVAITP